MNRHDHRDRYREARRPEPKPKPARNYNLRFLVLLGVGLGAALLISRTPFKSDRAVTSPGPTKLAKLSPRNLQETSELNGIDGGAKAGQSALVNAAKLNAGPISAPPPGGTVTIVSPIAETSNRDAAVTVTKADPQHPHAAIRIVGVRSDKAYTSRADAVADAQRVARQRLAEVLQSLDPPIRVLPSDEQIAADFVSPASIKEVAPSQEVKDLWKASSLDTNRQWATVDIEVSETQLRNLRGKQRLIDLGWILGAVFGVLGFGFGALKLDSLAKNLFTKSAASAAV